jgi:hypothetical protein
VGEKLDYAARLKLMQEGRCFICKEEGHRSPDCPKKVIISEVETEEPGKDQP